MPIHQATLDEIFNEIAGKAGGGGSTASDSGILLPQHHDIVADHKGALEQRFDVPLPVSIVRDKLTGFPRQWFGHVFRDDSQAFVFRITLPTSLWRRLCGNRPGIEVAVRLTPITSAADSAQPMVEITATVTPLGEHEPASLALSDELGRDILESLHRLLIDSGRRRHERLPWPHALKVTPLLDGRHGDPIQGCGKDISPCGIGLYLPRDLRATNVLIELPNAVCPPSLTVPARVIRVKRCADGWYEAGALFGAHTPARCW